MKAVKLVGKSLRTACVGENVVVGRDVRMEWVLGDGRDAYFRVYTADNRLVTYDVFADGVKICNEMSSDTSEVLELVRNELEMALEEEMEAIVIVRNPKFSCTFRRL